MVTWTDDPKLLSRAVAECFVYCSACVFVSVLNVSGLLATVYCLELVYTLCCVYYVVLSRFKILSSVDLKCFVGKAC